MAEITGSPVFTVTVHDATDAAEARRLARGMALDIGLSQTDAERAAIVTTEAATNLVKHADGGDMVVRVPVAGESTLDILAIDRGRGMANLAECMRDGFTTTGTAGNGLGAILRQSSFFDAYSKAGSGTVLLSRISAGSKPAVISTHDSKVLVDGLSYRQKGEQVCGDNWGVKSVGETTAVIVADGLGHGETAAEAADEAVRVFHLASSLAPADLLEVVHRALMKTRGAAVSIAKIDAGRGQLTYGGVGNVSATVCNGQPDRHLVSLHGTAGHQVRRLQEFAYTWNTDDLLIMHSDGVSAHWTLAAYPGLSQRHPLVIAAVLLRDYSRLRDDATVVVARNTR